MGQTKHGVPTWYSPSHHISCGQAINFSQNPNWSYNSPLMSHQKACPRDSFVRMPPSPCSNSVLWVHWHGWNFFCLGQPVCRGGTQRPCYKVLYFHDASRRLNFEEARAACRRDGGQLVSIESEDEQRLIEKFIENLLASDGDFWIGLRRREEKQRNSTACQDLYTWMDGSVSTFR